MTMAIQGSAWGHLGQEPEVRQAGNTPMLTFSLATKHRAKVDGQWQNTTMWVRVSHFGQNVQRVADMLHKGSGVIVTGEFTLREYTKDGEKRSSMECNARDVTLFGNAPHGDTEHAPAGNGGYGGNQRSNSGGTAGGGKGRGAPPSDDGGMDDNPF